MKQVAGIDVGKHVLDVSISGKPVQRYENSVAGRTSLRVFLQENVIDIMICESTGGYERALVDELRGWSVEVHMTHPNKVRAYAKALGWLGRQTG